MHGRGRLVISLSKASTTFRNLMKMFSFTARQITCDPVRPSSLKVVSFDNERVGCSEPGDSLNHEHSSFNFSLWEVLKF